MSAAEERNCREPREQTPLARPDRISIDYRAVETRGGLKSHLSSWTELDRANLADATIGEWIDR